MAGFILVCMLTGAATMGVINQGIVNTFFGNLAYAYRDYGIPYCFISTWVNTGIKKPNNYSKEEVDKILASAGLSERKSDYFVQGDPADSKKYPNIIYLQLESFVDPKLFTNIQCDKDPMSYYRQLMKDYSSGALEVPACGAGTANTEFETLTGVSARVSSRPSTTIISFILGFSLSILDFSLIDFPYLFAGDHHRQE